MDLYRFDWLAQRVEEPLDPDRTIVDAHHHLWEHPTGRYLAEELNADSAAGHNVVETVFVECRAKYHREGPEHLAPVGETAFVAAQAERSAAIGGPRISAIVSFADMTLGDAVEDVLRAHVEAGRGLFRGIRHATAIDVDAGRSHTDPTEGMMGTTDFRAGVAKLGELGHSFDAWLFHHQLDELLGLARAVPGTRIVLDHLGGPLGVGHHQGHEAGVTTALRNALAPLAECENVVVKLGGVGMDRYYGMGWSGLDRPPSLTTTFSHSASGARALRSAVVTPASWP